MSNCKPKLIQFLRIFIYIFNRKIHEIRYVLKRFLLNETYFCSTFIQNLEHKNISLQILVKIKYVIHFLSFIECRSYKGVNYCLLLPPFSFRLLKDIFFLQVIFLTAH